MFFSLLRKDLFKGRWSLRPIFFKLNHCHACGTRFAAFFALLSCCVSSLLAWRNEPQTNMPQNVGSKARPDQQKNYQVTHWILKGWIYSARHKHNTGRNQNRAKQLSVDDLVQHRPSVVLSVSCLCRAKLIFMLYDQPWRFQCVLPPLV